MNISSQDYGNLRNGSRSVPPTPFRGFGEGTASRNRRELHWEQGGTGWNHLGTDLAGNHLGNRFGREGKE